MTMLSQPLMSMSDVASLAAVERPVVTLWRKRPCRTNGIPDPFPTPSRVHGSTELFAADDVADWLERTGRGNNTDPRADLAAYVQLPVVQGSRVTPADAVEAVLCLSVAAETSITALSGPDIVDLAEELDPDDTFLFREIDALADDAPAVAGYVERLLDAAFGGAGALEVIDGRRRTGLQDARMMLAPSALQVVGEVAAAIALDLSRDELRIEDPTGCAA